MAYPRQSSSFAVNPLSNRRRANSASNSLSDAVLIPPAKNPASAAQPTKPLAHSDLAPAIAIAAAVAVLHLATNSHYGFHRDELQFLSDGRHLDWGSVVGPPLTPFLARVSFTLFGSSLVALRSFSALAQSLTILLTAQMARELGGKRFSSTLAALAVALSPIPLFDGTQFIYSSFDYFFWVLIAWIVLRLIRTQNPRYWLAIGAAAGFGILTKYSIAFLLTSLFLGALLTPLRKLAFNRWAAAGAGLALLFVFPNFLWQLQHHFVSLHFLQQIHDRDLAMGRADNFLSQQFFVCINIAAAPLFLAGLIESIRHPRYRVLAWMYALPLAIFLLTQGRYYYLAPAYPMLIALGARALERWLGSTPPAPSAKPRRSSRKPRRPVAPRIFAILSFTAILLWGAWIAAMMIPFAARGPLRKFALDRNYDMREEFGWPELVRTVASIRNSLPPEQQARLGILATNYGEAGALELLGPAYHLPAPFSGMNTFWFRGYPSPTPQTLIVLGMDRDIAESLFTGCRIVAANRNSEGVPNEESQLHPLIFLCGPPRQPWPEFWQSFQSFG